jgi:hypothetical protein
LSEAHPAGFEPVKRWCLYMTAASGGDCVYMLLVGKDQKDILRFRSAVLPGSKDVLCRSTVG